MITWSKIEKKELRLNFLSHPNHTWNEEINVIQILPHQ